MVVTGPAVLIPPVAAAALLVALMSARHALILYSGCRVFFQDSRPMDKAANMDFAQVLELLRRGICALEFNRSELGCQKVADVVSALVAARHALDSHDGEVVVVSDGPERQTKVDFRQARMCIDAALMALAEVPGYPWWEAPTPGQSVREAALPAPGQAPQDS